MGLRSAMRVSGHGVSGFGHTRFTDTTAKAIELDPKYAKAYYRYVKTPGARGDVHRLSRNLAGNVLPSDCQASVSGCRFEESRCA